MSEKVEILKMFAKTVKEQVKPFVNNQNNLNGEISGILQLVLNWMYWIVGIVAVVMIIVGGIMMATSAGNPMKVMKAKHTITWGVIGLVVALVAFAIVTFVVNVFSGK